jgi:hypothetical protein
MSGWDTYDWARIILCAFFVLTGAVNLLLPYREGSPRWPWFVMIGAGILNLVDHHALPRSPGVLIAVGGIGLACALWVLLAEPFRYARRLQHQEVRRSRYEERLAATALDADEYSEAMRVFQASSPVPASMSWRLANAAIFTLFGGAFLALGLNAPR